MGLDQRRAGKGRLTSDATEKHASLRSESPELQVACGNPHLVIMSLITSSSRVKFKGTAQICVILHAEPFQSLNEIALSPLSK